VLRIPTGKRHSDSASSHWINPLTQITTRVLSNDSLESGHPFLCAPGILYDFPNQLTLIRKMTASGRVRTDGRY
jgi:hypothetical protein